MADPREVRSMFARIAGRYDLLNRVLSGGIDRRWRRRAVAAVAPAPGTPVADVACGTGDLTLALERAGARAVGVDFTPEMLVRARGKAGGAGPPFATGDALRLPLADDSVGAATIAFGLRNVADRGLGLAELARIVRPGGRVVVLEFGRPPGRVLGALYRLYFTRVLPRIGGLVSGDAEAYRYLPDTVEAWPAPEVLADEMRAVGLEDCRFEPLSLGIAWLHVGRAPGGEGA